MATYMIELREETIASLEELARAAGISPERFLSDEIERRMGELRAEQERFSSAADYVLKKNQELYRRLA